MKLIIEMDDIDYYRIKVMPDAFNSLTSRAYKSIKNSTPIPEALAPLITKLIDDAKEIENG